LISVWKANSIKAYEPCQVRKEAAISRYFYVELFSIERLIFTPFFKI